MELYERIPVAQIKVGDFVPAGINRWTKVIKVEHVGTRALLYLDEDSMLRDDLPLNFPLSCIWTRRMNVV